MARHDQLALNGHLAERLDEIGHDVRHSYLDYAMNVIVGRGIRNESNLAGENVGRASQASVDVSDCDTGSASAAPAAPEVAADDDGDGDSDPEPERQTQRQSVTLRRTQPHHRAASVQSNSCRLNKSHREANMDQTPAIPFVVEHFDRVSDSTHIDIAALKAITGKSRATLYRWIDKGLLPKPRKLGPTHNFWTAGEIRRALSV